jgi:predicted alpha/beta superfamily hydrolase
MQLDILGRNVEIYSEGAPERAICLIGEKSDELWPMIRGRNAALIAVPVADWNRELSPWPAPKCFRGGDPFEGKADDFLAALRGQIMPAAEAAAGLRPKKRYLAGYSLAGLFALYALLQTADFDGAASVSGSLWFDGWMEFARAHPLPVAGARVYFSLGDREEHTANPRLAGVGDGMRETAKLFRAQGADVCVEMNPGSHFVEIPARIGRGLAWLLREPAANSGE